LPELVLFIFPSASLQLHILQRMRGRVKFDTAYEVRGPSNLGLILSLIGTISASQFHSTIDVPILSCFTSLDLEINIYLMRRFNESSVSCGIRQRIKLLLSFVGNIVEISLKLTILGKLYTVDYSGLTPGQSL
jgi:hypothetical protein